MEQEPTVETQKTAYDAVDGQEPIREVEIKALIAHYGKLLGKEAVDYKTSLWKAECKKWAKATTVYCATSVVLTTRCRSLRKAKTSLAGSPYQRGYRHARPRRSAGPRLSNTANCALVDILGVLGTKT